MSGFAVVLGHFIAAASVVFVFGCGTLMTLWLSRLGFIADDNPICYIAAMFIALAATIWAAAAAAKGMRP